MNVVAILAGGMGTRLKSSLPKQFIKLDNKPILIHTISRFIDLDDIDLIIVAIPFDYLEYTRNLLEEFYPNNNIILIKGGNTRNETLLNVLNYLNTNYKLDSDDIILTHDAVRPFVTKRIINDNIDICFKYGACVTAIGATDTILETKKCDVINVPNREYMYQAQTPQTFKILELLNTCNCLTEDEKNTLTDASRIYVLKNKLVKLVEGELYNIKITTKLDLLLANSIMGYLDNVYEEEKVLKKDLV